MKRAIVIISAVTASLCAIVLAFLFYYLGVTAGTKLDPAKLSLDVSCVRLYDAADEEIGTAAGKRNTSIDALPDYVKNAFVAVEDKRFYSHRGLDHRRIAKALLKNIASFSFREGASTISQQLIKNTHLSGEKTVKRKLREVKLTRALEKRYSKDEILELYLNSIYFGHNAFGIENAARFYFGKDASALSPAEGATLAALVRSPNRYSPFRDAEKCLSRRNFVLSLMREQGYLTAAQEADALRETLPQQPTEESANAYLNRVFEELGELLPDLRTADAQNIRVYTFLDRALQQKFEETETRSDVCFLAVDNRTHGLKALRATPSPLKRLPASVIKPLLVYAPALEEDVISPATPILDEKTDFGGYSPSDFGGKYGGYMSARYALAHSVNIPAVKILNSLGVERGARYLARMGLEVPKEDLTLALALGGMREGFTLSALADAYSTLACGGEFAPSRAVARIEDADGNVLYRFKPAPRRVFSEETVWLVNDMLQSAVKEGTAKRLNVLPFPVCAKTGTNGTDGGNTDAYTVAYTREDTVAVWMGNRDNSPVDTMGGGAPANVALAAMQALYGARTPEAFPPCDGVEEAILDRDEYEGNHRLLLADPASPPATGFAELFKRSALPKSASTRFSHPSIQMPRIFVVNGAVCIELCQTKYYEYTVKREGDGQTATIYRGKYREKIFDNSVKSGVSYRYTVIPTYLGKEGDAVKLPAVRVEKSAEIPEDWWDQKETSSFPATASSTSDCTSSFRSSSST